MKRLALLSVLAVAGCAGGVTRQEADTLKAELVAADAKIAADLKGELAGLEQKYATMQQLQNQVEKKLEEVAKLEKAVAELSQRLEVKVGQANDNVIRVLEFEEKLLAERLGSIRAMLADLKKQ